VAPSNGQLVLETTHGCRKLRESTMGGSRTKPYSLAQLAPRKVISSGWRIIASTSLREAPIFKERASSTFSQNQTNLNENSLLRSRVSSDTITSISLHKNEDSSLQHRALILHEFQGEFTSVTLAQHGTMKSGVLKTASPRTLKTGRPMTDLKLIFNC